MFGLLPKCRCQNPWLKITSGSTTLRSVRTVNVRPRSGVAPMTVKKFAVTRSARTSTGGPSPVRLARASSQPARSAKVRLSSRQSCRDVSEKREPEVRRSIIRRSDSGKLSGRSNTESTMVKMAVLPPIPNATVAITTAAKTGVCRNRRSAYLRS